MNTVTKLCVSGSFAVILSCFAWPGPLYASEEEILEPSEVTITADAGASFGKVTAEITTHNEPENRTISGIRLNINGGWVSVPEKALADLRNPLLNSTEIRTEAGYDEHPWLYIYFELAHRDPEGKFVLKRVHIAYHNGKLVFRSVDIPESNGSYKHERMEL